MSSRRFLVFLGLFSILALALVVTTAGLAGANVLKVRGHVTLGWLALLPIAAYLVLSVRWIASQDGK